MIALDFGSKEVIFVGDSNLKGTPYVIEQERWSTLICAERNGIEVNLGVPGQGWLNPGNQFDKNNIPFFDAAVHHSLWLANGTNDIGVTENNQLIDGVPFKAKLLEIVDFAFSDRGWPYEKMVLPTINLRTDANSKPVQQAQFNMAIEEVCALKNNIFIPLLAEFSALPNVEDLILEDGVHYNSLGHRADADIYEAADYTPYNGSVTIGIRLPFRLSNTPTPPEGEDEDPFLLTWDTGTRINGIIPWQANDAYLEDNVHDIQGFNAWRDGTTDNFYNDGIKIQDNPSYPIRINVRKYKAKVSSLRVFFKTNYNDTNFYYIKKGEFTKNLIATVPFTTTGWQTLNLPQTEDVTWIIVETLHSGDSPNQVEINGSYIVPTSITPTIRKPLFKKMTWQNIFNWNVLDNDGRPFTRQQRIDLLKQHDGVRHYLDRYHLEPFEGDYYFQPSYNGAGSWPLDDFYQLLFDNNIDVRACIKNFPESFQASWPSELRSSEQLPVEYQGSREATTEWAFQPEAYLAEGKLFFQFAARYGSTVVADNLLSVHTEPGGVFPNNIKRTGLGLVSKMELTNEPDSWWQWWKGFQKARQMAARMSCIWDGHKGTLGNNVGVKNADPNMSLSMPGLGVATFEELMSMLDWFREYRGYKEDGKIDIPFDCINYHVYSNDGGSSQYGSATRGMPPETSGFADKMEYFVDLSDEYMYGMPVILGEYGYDISQFSKQRAARIIDIGSETSDKTIRKLVQSQWILRSMLLGWINGLHEVQAYVLDDISNDEYGNYAQSGWNDSQTLTRRPIGNFSYQSLQLLGNYQVEEVINTSPYVVKATDETSEIIYVLWSPTETANTTEYNLDLTDVIEVIMYDLSSTDIIPTETVLSITDGNLTLTVTETPVFIKITNSDIPDNEQVIIDTFDNVYFIKNALNRSGTPIQDGQIIDQIPNSKGSDILVSSERTATPRTEMMKYNSNMGGIVNLDNENLFYLVNPTNINITAPCEIHFTGLQTCFFPFEAYLNVYGLYMGEFGGGFRFTNGNTSDVTISPAAFPTGEAFHVRLLYNADKTVSCYLNNVFLGTKNTYFTGESNFLQRLGLGTDTNNAKWFPSSITHCNRQLTTEEANNVYNAFKDIYLVDGPMPFPYIQNVGISYNSSTVTATGTYYSPSSTLENTSLRKYRWYKAGNNVGAPDVTNNTRVPELDDLQSWSKTTFASLLTTDIWFRVDIECTDVNDIGLGSASGCAYVKVV